MTKTRPSPCIAALVFSCAALALSVTAHADFFGALDKVAKALKQEADKNSQKGGAQAASGQQSGASGQQASSAVHHVAAGGGDIWHAIPLAPKTGTPEGTAALIKEMPALGAGEFTLGMSADDALAKMKALGYKDAPGQNFYFQIRQVPDQTFLGGAIGVKGGEQIRLNFTMYPNPAVVSGITRMLPIDPASAPTVNTMLAALRDKYGAEIAKEGHQLRMYWAFDHAGHPLSALQYKELQKLGCGFAFNDGSEASRRFTVGNPDTQARKVAQGYPLSNLARHSPDTEPCYDIIAIAASVDAEDPHRHTTTSVDYGGGWDKIGDSIVTNVTIAISNGALDFSAATVSHDLAIHYDDVQRQKEEEAAKKHKAPTL